VTRGAALALVLAAAAFARPSRAQETPQLPPPPPPSSPPQYTPLPTPPQPGPGTPPPPPRREKEREPPLRREHEREKEREREREVVVVRPRYVVAPAPVVVRDEPPPARRWVQVAFRSGVSFPAGSISGAPNDPMSGDFGLQVPIFLEAGIKVHPMIFLGAYTSLSIGGTSSAFADAQGCVSGSSRGCGSTDWRIGLEVQVHFRPAELVNPWLGYGLGFEQVSASASGGGSPATGETFSGLELARIGGGADFRVSRIFGFGPFIEVDFGSYSQEHVQGVTATGAASTVDQSISNTGLHEWVTLGVRGVLFP